MRFDFSLEPGRASRRRYAMPPGQPPQISVITPFYNAWAQLGQTRDSLLNQTFPWFEWIVVDDGSGPPPAPGFWDGFDDPRIRLIRQGNAGAAAARNRGIGQSRAGLVFFLDADDLIDERCLEYTYFALQQNPDAMWAYGDSVGFQGDQYLWHKAFRSQRMRRENLLPYAALIRKSVFEIPDIYPGEAGNQWEDYRLWLRLLARRYYPAHIELPLFWYRRTDEGALSRIENDPAVKRSLRREIRGLAKAVPGGIQAITFNGKRVGEFIEPKVWPFEPALPFAEDKTRILLLLPHMECGGADKFNLDLLKHLDHSRYELGVITTTPAENEWRQEFQKYADDIFELPAFLDMNDWASFIHYYIATRQVKILWNISSYFGYYTLPWLRLEFPELAIIDCVHAEGTYWRAGGYPRVSAAVDSVLDRTFVTNAFTRDILVEKYGKPLEKTQVIYTGVDEREFVPEATDGEWVRQQYGLGERPTVLYLCRMAPEKRPFLMLEIAREVRQRVPDICFLAVGDGPQLEELKAKASDLEGCVIFTGRVGDTRPYYKAADLFLLCSIKEGLSITTMEAMLMELPVISAGIGSQYELVDGKTGSLIQCRQDEAKDFDSRDFPHEEVSEYVEAIAGYAASRERCRRVGRACREKMLGGYTLKTMVDTLDQAFSQLCQPEVAECRAEAAKALLPFRRMASEFLNIYKEYDAIEINLRGIYRAIQYLKALLTFQKTPLTVWREVGKRRCHPIWKRVWCKLFVR